MSVVVCVDDDLVEDEVVPSSNTAISGYLNPRETADIICDHIIPEIFEKDNWSGDEATWMEKRSVIRSSLIQNDYDSIRVRQLVEAGEERNLLHKMCGDGGGSHSVKSDEIFHTKLGKTEVDQLWRWVARAVSHEMTPKMAEHVLSASATLPPKEWDNYPKGGEIVAAINSETSKTLTHSEAEYLKALITRTSTISVQPTSLVITHLLSRSL